MEIGKPALLIATENNKGVIVSALINAGADTDAVNTDGKIIYY